MTGTPIRVGAICLAFAAGLGLAGSALADPIAIFSTGVDGSGNLLSGGSTDTHWTVGEPDGDDISNDAGIANNDFLSYYNPAATFTNAAVVPTSNYWGGNPQPSAQVISFSAGATSGYVPFTYETTFDLTGLDPSTASITLEFYADDLGEIALNGNLIGSTYNEDFTAITLDSGFVDGINTLEFVTYNEGGPGGLLVDIESATADEAAPEPASLAILCAGLAGLAATRRRKFLRR